MDFKPDILQARRVKGFTLEGKSKDSSDAAMKPQSNGLPQEVLKLGSATELNQIPDHQKAPKLGSAAELNAISTNNGAPKLGSATELNAISANNGAPELGSALELNQLPEKKKEAAPLNLAGFEVVDQAGTNTLGIIESPTDVAASAEVGDKKVYVDFSAALNNALSAAEVAEMSGRSLTKTSKSAHAWEPKKSGSPLKSILRTSRQIGNVFKSILGDGDPAFHLKEEQQEILALETKYSAKDPVTGEFLIPDLSVKTAEFKELLKSGKATLDDIRADAYAVAREASARALGMRHYPCQVLGGLAMDQGSIAEMMTGEGKTLTAVLPLYLNALACDENGKSKGAHLITVNDTLAQRDGEEMRPVFESLGMTLGVVTEGKTPEEKRAAYNCDITYATNNAIGFDYLRDQMVQRPEDRVQRPLHYALVDEVDMVLIDEASTPLILSIGEGDDDGDYRNFDRILSELRTDGSDFHISNKEKRVDLTPEGLRFVETHLAYQEAGETARETNTKATLQSAALEETQAEYKAHQQDLAHLEAFKEDIEDPKKLKAFQNAIKDGAFSFLGDETLKRLRREGPRPGDLREMESDLADSEAIFEGIIPEMEIQAKQSQQEAKLAQMNFGKTRDSLEKMNAWRNALPGDDVEGLKAAYDDAFVAAPEYNIYEEENMHRVNLMENALKSNFLFHEGEDYLVLDGEVKIVDQFKGRTPAGRRYSDGLHQALEAKENVVIKTPTRTSASITYPNLFKLYEGSPEMRNEPGLTNGLAGMSGTAVSERMEFGEFYDVDVVPIPTNKAVILKKQDTRYFPDRKAKVAAVVKRAKELFEAGKPVLIGTVSVEDNEYLAGQLQAAGIPCQVLNAKSVKGNTEEEKAQIARESEMIKNAGQSGMVTVATNMAGRGINIKPDWIAHSKLSQDVMRSILPLGQMASKIETLMKNGSGAELFVGNQQTAEQVVAYFKGEGVKAKADPNRPGYVIAGESQNRTTLDFKDFPPKPAVVDVKDEKELKKLRHWFDISNVPVQVVDGAAEAPPAGTVQIRVLDTELSRKDPASYENVTPRAPVPEGVEYFAAESYFTEGLHVLATEAHDSPRIDRQLIGRAGRQGAPGQYEFFLSVQDRVLKFFGGDKLKESFESIAKKAGVDPTEGVTSPRLDKLVAKAQESVGKLQYNQRFESNEFDETDDKHRKVFYSIRAGMVESENVTELVQDWTTFHFKDQVFENLPNRTLRGFKPAEVKSAIEKASKKLGFDFPIDLKLREDIKKDDLAQRLTTYLKGLFVESEIDDDSARSSILESADSGWSRFLDDIELLQLNIGWEAQAQQDPKLRYKIRSAETFQDYLSGFEQEAIKSVAAGALKEAAEKPGYFGSREALIQDGQASSIRAVMPSQGQGERVDAEPESLLEASRERAIEHELLPVGARFWSDEVLQHKLSELPLERTFHSYQESQHDENGLPINPSGSTGKAGRGDFPRFGANFKAMPVLLKRDRKTQELRVLTLSDGSLPSGEVEYGESTPDWLTNGLFPLEESKKPRGVLRARNIFRANLDQSATLFAGGVEHPDNRDQAWWEVQSKSLELPAETEPSAASGLRWQKLDSQYLESLDEMSKDLVVRALGDYQKAHNYKVAKDGTVGRRV